MQQLVNRFARVRRSLLRALKGFPADRVEVALFGEWNLKCVLAHLAAWDSYFTEILGLLGAGEEVPYWGSIRKFNEASVKKREGWTWDEVHDEFVRAGEEFIEQYGSVGEGLWSKRFWKRRSYTPTKVVEINTHHYESHSEEIRNACPSCWS